MSTSGRTRAQTGTNRRPLTVGFARGDVSDFAFVRRMAFEMVPEALDMLSAMSSMAEESFAGWRGRIGHAAPDGGGGAWSIW